MASYFIKAEKMFVIKAISEVKPDLLEEFFLKCREFNYVNNTSKQKMKVDWVLNKRKGEFFIALLSNKIVAVAGCHWIPEIAKRAFRVQFRGCELPKSDIKKTLSRAHFNSITFRELLPYQLKWMKKQGDYFPCLSVNKGVKNHRAMQLMEKQGFLTYLGEKKLFYVDQTVWRFNTNHYLKIRNKIKTYSQL